MKTLNIDFRTFHLRLAIVALALILRNDCQAQIQQAWVARYNNGITHGTNAAIKMAFDSTENIYVAGVSQNTNGNLGYVTIKYTSNGTESWSSRYDSSNFPSSIPSAMVVDGSNNVVVTGTALTIEYDANGNQLWTAPYDGAAMAADSNGYVYITGFGTNFNTVKLSSSGSNLWITTCVDVGPTVGQAIVADSNGNVYVSGSDTYQYYNYGYNPQTGQPYYVPEAQLLIIKYASNGGQVWLAQHQNQTPTGVQVNGIALDVAENLYLAVGWTPGNLV